jgi:integrase
MDIDMVGKRVVIDAGVSKVWKRRTSPLCDDAVKWLTLAKEKFSRLPVSKSTARRFIRKIRDRLGLKAWPQDSLRHTAATALLKKHEDAGKVARWLGNSERVLLKNYIG